MDKDNLCISEHGGHRSQQKLLWYSVEDRTQIGMAGEKLEIANINNAFRKFSHEREERDE